MKIGVGLIMIALVYALSSIWWWALNGMHPDIAIAHFATTTAFSMVAFTLIMREVG